MRYQDPVTGEWKTISVKAADTLPIGTEVDYDGDTVPDGWEQIVEPGSYALFSVDTRFEWSNTKVWNLFGFPTLVKKGGDDFIKFLTHEYEITADIKRIRLTTQITLKKEATVYWVMASAEVNDESKDVTLIGDRGNADDWHTIRLDTILDVKKGDIVSVKVYKDSTGIVTFDPLMTFKNVATISILFEVIE